MSQEEECQWVADVEADQMNLAYVSYAWWFIDAITLSEYN